MTSSLPLAVWLVVQVPLLVGGQWWVPARGGLGASGIGFGTRLLSLSQNSAIPSPAVKGTQASSQDLTQMCKEGGEVIASQ